MKERVLLHLIDYAKYADALEVPSAITQEGIAREAGINVPHFMQYVRPLVRDGVVRERMAHVRGSSRRRKVYDLTELGQMQAVRLREKVRGEVVRVRDATGLRQATVAQVLREAGDRLSLLEVLRQASESGAVDLLATRAPPHAFIDMLADAPRLQRFVGRRAELEAVTKEGERARVFVVRGVAGIGKSSLGAKATEALRGKRNLFWREVRPWDTHLSILASLGDFLAALGKPGLRSVLSRGAVERAVEVLREDMPGTQSFLVMDDAHEASSDALASLRLLKEIVADASDVHLLVLTREVLPFYDRRDVVVRGLVQEIELRGLRPEEAEPLLPASPTRENSDIVRRVGGHPLFLELVRASPDALPASALRDVRRFVEEEVYRKLSDEERRMMKAAALYKVPVPREALFADEALTEDVLLSLTGRSLIRPVGEGRYEVHEAVQDIFSAIQTPTERRTLVEFAVSQLRSLAAESLGRENFVDCARYLANALQMPVPSATRLEILESLGDADERMGDVDVAIGAYREALELTTAPEVLARLHRKIANPLAARGELAEAIQEIEAGFRALGDVSSVERGWLHLARTRVVVRSDYEEGRREGEAALRIFRQFSDVSGQANACVELGYVTGFSGATNPEGLPLAEQYYGEALRLVESLADVRLAGRLHVIAAERAYYQAGNVDEFREHLDAAEAFATRAKDPILSRQLLTTRALLKFYRFADFDGSTADAAEALDLSAKIRDPEGISLAKYWLAQCSRARGQIAEARLEFEEAAKGFGTSRPVSFYEIFATGYAGECCLMEGDADGYRRILADQVEAMEVHPAWTGVLEGLRLLIEGRPEDSETRFRDAIRFAESQSAKGTLFRLEVGLVHFYYAAALRALGRRREASGEIERALGAWRAYNNQGFLLTAASREKLLVDGLRKILKTR